MHSHTHTLAHLRSPWEETHLKYLDPQASWIKSCFLFFTNMPTSLAVESIHVCAHVLTNKTHAHIEYTERGVITSDTQTDTHMYKHVAHTHFKTDF